LVPSLTALPSDLVTRTSMFVAPFRGTIGLWALSAIRLALLPRSDSVSLSISLQPAPSVRTDRARRPYAGRFDVILEVSPGVSVRFAGSLSSRPAASHLTRRLVG